ncbi:hypothetical protein [Streptomyces sp. WAC 06783]|uniref:hypothetical protein n=1 Tax=Streptomyces sp. WAC 06783 TaxID=2203211 RepID=UPI000F740717|nr:hypothetical protein [Streptomyces sp. WAC 06783]
MAVDEAQCDVLRERLDEARKRAGELRRAARAVIEENHRLVAEHRKLRRHRVRRAATSPEDC